MKQVLLFTGLLAMATSAYAVGDKGNGGYSIVCRDNSSVITSTELLDIYEGRILYKRHYAVNHNSVDELIDLALAKVSENSAFASKLAHEIALIDKNHIFIPVGHELESTDDAFPAIKKKGCEFEQLANYTEAGEILISQEIYDQLDNVNRAGLVIHEAIYAIRRKALGEETSKNTRRLVAHLMAVNGDRELIARMVSESLYRRNGKKRACGTEGSIKVRIENCSYQEPSKGDFHLLTRTSDLKEVWIDTKNNLLWGDRFTNYQTFDQAAVACEEMSSEMGYLYEYNWRLPSEEEFSRHGHYLTLYLPNMNNFNTGYWFWSSTVRGRSVITYDGLEGVLSYNMFKKSAGSVRCVAPLPLQARNTILSRN